MICMTNREPPAYHVNRIRKPLLESKISRVNFRDLVLCVLSVDSRCFLTVIHFKVSILSIQTCLGMLHTILFYQA